MATAAPTLRKAPIAHPWEHTAIIDRNAPRTNQAVMGIGATIALAFGVEWIVALLALQLTLGLTLGRKWCLTCWLYFGVIQPRLGEGRLEDSRAPRFAMQIALACTSLATVAFIAGLETVGWAFTAMIAVVALFSAISGFCVGCWVWAKLHPGEACEICEVPQLDAKHAA